MKLFIGFTKKQRILLIFTGSLLLSSCIGTVIGVAVDTTIEVVKVPFKIVGAVVDVAIPDGDDED